MSESNDKQDDHALDGYLAGDSTLSRRYRDADEATPSAALDRTILDAARDAVAETHTRRRARMTLMWERPWAIAAVVALSAVLVVSIQREAGLFAPETPAAKQDADFVVEDEVRVRQAPRALPETPADADDIAASKAVSRVVTAKQATTEADPATEAMRETNDQTGEGRETGDRAAAAREISDQAAAGQVMNKRAAVASSEAQPSTDAALPGDIDAALREIRAVWEAGDGVQARALLAGFRERHPEVDEETLRDALPEALLADED